MVKGSLFHSSTFTTVSFFIVCLHVMDILKKRRCDLYFTVELALSTADPVLTFFFLKKEIKQPLKILSPPLG